MSTKELSLLGKIETISKSISYILMPIIVAVVGWYIQDSLTDKTLDKEYVEMAAGILIQEKNDKKLRAWAVQIINNYSRVPFSEELEKEVINGNIVLPNTIHRKITFGPGFFEDMNRIDSNK